jgi:hypothetical protein
MADQTIKIKIDVDNQPIKSLKSELRETVQQLQQMDQGSEEFAKMTQKAAELKDQIADVNEQINVFASGSKYEQASNSLGEIGSAIRNLDFDKAAARAGSFAKIAKSITFGDAIKSVKDLGKTFVTLGKAMLTNPLFLIAAVVAAIVMAIVGLLDKLGILDKMFKVVGDAIGYVVQRLKDMLDWLGLTSYAAEDAAARQAVAQEQVAQAHEKKRESVVDAYNHEIKMANIAGKDTTALERQKQHAIIETSKQQLIALNTQIKAMRAAGNLTKEKADEIRKAMGELRNGIKEARQEIQVINAQEVADNKAANEKKAADNKAARVAAAQQRKQDAADRLAASRAIQDAELSIMAEGQEKEIKSNTIKYQRLIADTLANEKLKQSEKDKITAALLIESNQKEVAINKTFTDAEAAKTLEENAKKAEAQKAFEQKMFNLRAETLQKQIDAFKIIQEQELTDLQTQLNEKLISEEQFQAAKKALAEKTNLEIDALNQEQAAKEMALNKAVKDGALELASQALAGLAANMKEGSNAAKAVAVAQASMDTYRAATAAFASTAANPITTVFPAAPFIAAASAVAMGIANVRKILSVQPQNGGGSAPSAAGGSAPSFGSMTSQSTPQMNLNNNTAQQNAGGESNRERVIVVDYHDIQNKGNELEMSNQRVTLA